MDARTLQQAITPLRLVFWGGLLCLFDISFSFVTNGQGFKFDILNDALGCLLIAVGVFRLRKIPVNGRYDSVMGFVLAVSVLAVLDAIRDHFILPLPAGVNLVLSLFGLITLSAIVSFCIAMRWLCEAAVLAGAARSWSVTTVLFAVIYLLPLGLLHLLGIVALVSDSSFNLDLGVSGLLLLPLFAVPLIHLFVSTSRMQRAIRGLPFEGTGGVGIGGQDGQRP